MPTAPTAALPQETDFSRDVLGRFVCNGLDEALRSADTGRRPDARPFDIVVLGGGTFGAVIAQHLFSRDATHAHRILVLEGGPLVLAEHVQNLPMLGLNVPGASSIQQLRQDGQFGPASPREQVWGLPWHSPTPFTGLAYCVGGRSLYWGGWSPQLLEEETPTAGPAGHDAGRWPVDVVAELRNPLPGGGDSYFTQAGEQIGVTETNDFIYGALQNALRQQLAAGIEAGSVTDAIPLGELPDHPALRPGASPGVDTLLALLGLPAPIPGVAPPDRQRLRDLLKLEAPLAVQTRARAGFFATNKFSAVPLLIKAARAAWAEAGGDDVQKRLMVVPNCHVTRLVTERAGALWRVAAVETSQGTVPLPPGGKVVIALATVESTRLALLSFQDIPNYGLIGRNLMAHLRSNLNIRVPRTALAGLDPAVHELQAGALFLKGRHEHADGSVGHFHLQITAAGLDALGTDSEAELFKRVPDVDSFTAFRAATDSHVVITIRGIGEMEPQNPNNAVRLDAETDEWVQRRAFVTITPGDKDRALWNAMDRAADDVARVFAAGQPFEVFTPRGPVPASAATSLADLLPYAASAQGGRRDGLGTTHHETGTLWMGDLADTSVTNPDGHLHYVPNACVAGPALFPTIGSPNPMLTGIALARRTADRIIPAAVAAPEAGFTALFDGTQQTFRRWQMAGGGTFALVDGTLVAYPDPQGRLGLLYYTATFGDYVLRLDFRLDQANDNSGVFLRFRDPRLPVPDRTNPTVSYPYQNQAWVAVDTGFEVQIDEQAGGDPARGIPPGLDLHRTGAIYNVPTGTGAGQQAYRRGPVVQPGTWHSYEIEVSGDTYVVRLDGQETTRFTNPDAARGRPPARDAASGFIGLQTHTGRVAFRNVRIRPAAAAAGPTPAAGVTPGRRAAGERRRGPARPRPAPPQPASVPGPARRRRDDRRPGSRAGGSRPPATARAAAPLPPPPPPSPRSSPAAGP